MYIKNFLDWFKLKPRLDQNNHKPPYFKEGEIWWVKIGENIGTEISGKSQNYTRPVIVYIKFSKYNFLGIPLTTVLLDKYGNERAGVWFLKLSIKNKDMLAILNQVRIFDYRRMDKLISQIDSKSFNQIKIAFNNLFHKR